MLEDQKIPIQEAYSDVESETFPTAPGLAWMMLEKRGAGVICIYANEAFSSCPEATSAWSTSSAAGAAFICLLSLGRQRDRLSERPSRLTRTQSHPNTPGLEEQRV